LLSPKDSFCGLERPCYSWDMGKSKDSITLANDLFNEFLSKADPDAPPIIPPDEKRAKAKAAGKLGGLKGGKIRALRLSAKKRTNIAKKAAKSRWNNRKES
jgi:hypothetical protein